MWFDVFDAEKADATIDHLANWDHLTDWGMRIISEQDSRFGPTGYHFGSVWPLFTGWAAVAEYRYHRSMEAYANLRANALLALDGPLGRVTEVLSGSYYEGLGTASPHQIWSSAMVLSPIVRGMLGLAYKQEGNTMVLAPHLPASWNHFGIRRFSWCAGKLDFDYMRETDGIHLKIAADGGAECSLELSPSVSKHAQVLDVTWKGRRVQYKVEPTADDQHVSLEVPFETGEAVVRVRDDFGLEADDNLPPLGSESHNLKIFHEQWTADRRQLTLKLSGVSGNTYEVRAYGAKILSVSGAELRQGVNGTQLIEVVIPSGEAGRYQQGEIAIRF
jgi:hypothetical protein